METTPVAFPKATFAQWVLPLLLSPFGGLMLRIQTMRASQFTALPPAPGTVVFIGDSITEGGIWSEWFPGIAVSNRGISGEISADVLRRIDTAIHQPRAVFLLIGVNDINRLVPLQTIVDNIRAILLEIGRRAPGAPVFLQSVMPAAPKNIRRIQMLNAQLVPLAAETGASYIDLWPALAADDDTLRMEFTGDRLHLNGAGYKAWTDVLRPYVEAVAVIAP